MKEENKESTKKQLISAGTATKGLINGFISYGFLIGFITLVVFLVVTNIVNNIETSKNLNALNYTLPCIAAIIIFFLVRFVCNLSTFDLFKKCKIDKADVNKVSSKMNLFYILFIMFSLMVIIVNLTVRFKNQKNEIEQTKNEYYKIYSESFANDLTVEMIEEFSIDRLNSIIHVVIIESGLFLGTFSLVTTQKKLIEKYN